MYRRSKEPLFTAETIQHGIDELAKKIGQCGNFDMVLGVLTGSFVFVADLVRKLSNESLQIRFIKAESYRDSTKAGELHISGIDLSSIKGKRILLIDDILDTGRTLQAVVGMMKSSGAVDIKTCVLLDKPSRRETDFKADFSVFTIEDKFVIGYGLDYANNYRSLPEIWTLEEA
ncbi:MAG: hypoxanthine phosphoribosyltransferase [Fibrobacter sp.]|nr:hypoxanthine phosphoribosyltransferase [Fibrobacter sp.]